MTPAANRLLSRTLAQSLIRCPPSILGVSPRIASLSVHASRCYRTSTMTTCTLSSLSARRRTFSFRTCNFSSSSSSAVPVVGVRGGGGGGGGSSSGSLLLRRHASRGRDDNKGRFVSFLASNVVVVLASSALVGSYDSSSSGSAVSCEKKGGEGDGDGDGEDVLTKVTNMFKGGGGNDGDSGGGSSGDWNEELDKLATKMGSKVEEIVATGVPAQISSGFISGFCSGYALKKVGRVGAIVFGLGFCTLQSLSYAGYIHVDYDKVGRDMTSMLDLNEDGKIDKDDGKQIMAKIMEVLTYNLPAGSGFGTGFVAGVRSG